MFNIRVGYNSDLIGYTLCVFVKVWEGVGMLNYESDYYYYHYFYYYYYNYN